MVFVGENPETKWLWRTAMWCSFYLPAPNQRFSASISVSNEPLVNEICIQYLWKKRPQVFNENKLLSHHRRQSFTVSPRGALTVCISVVDMTAVQAVAPSILFGFCLALARSKPFTVSHVHVVKSYRAQYRTGTEVIKALPVVPHKAVAEVSKIGNL